MYSSTDMKCKSHFVDKSLDEIPMHWNLVWSGFVSFCWHSNTVTFWIRGIWQWGLEYRTRLVFQCSLRFGFSVVLVLNKMAAIYFKLIRNPSKMTVISFGFPMVWFWNGRDQSLSSDPSFQNLTIENPNLKKFGIPMCSAFHCSVF